MVTPTTRVARTTRTYIPEPSARAEILDFAAFMREIEAYLSKGSGRAALVHPDGASRAIPDEIFQILDQVVDALANGKAVTVAPSGMMLTTQQAADFLGISRPTLVKLLEEDKIPFERPGRHRRVALRDLVDFTESFHNAREAALDEVAKTTPGSRIQSADPTRIAE